MVGHVGLNLDLVGRNVGPEEASIRLFLILQDVNALQRVLVCLFQGGDLHVEVLRAHLQVLVLTIQTPSFGSEATVALLESSIVDQSLSAQLLALLQLPRQLLIGFLESLSVLLPMTCQNLGSVGLVAAALVLLAKGGVLAGQAVPLVLDGGEAAGPLLLGSLEPCDLSLFLGGATQLIGTSLLVREGMDAAIAD
ncbi:hypothetical protein PGQ11_001987 [Apiospora arundinis]|uniref:Uncharacterized protein n=1 Tax=Apiospora arundinis TaxID=335852 RepID=A0ABR2JH35_9PEZI